MSWWQYGQFYNKLKIKTRRTIEINTYQLSSQIDDLKEKVAYWQNKYEEEKAMNNKMLNENLASAKKGVANALMFALSVKDDADGNLIIDKESRKELADSWV